MFLRSQKSGRRPDFTKNAFFHQKINFFKKSKSGRRPDFGVGGWGGKSCAARALQALAGVNYTLRDPKKVKSPQGVDSQNLRM